MTETELPHDSQAPLNRMVTYRKTHLRVAEVLFDGRCASTADVDVVRYKFRPTPVHGYECAKSYTLWLNLQDNPNHLLANMRRSTRSQIRRALGEGFSYEFTSTPTRRW